MVIRDRARDWLGIVLGIGLAIGFQFVNKSLLYPKNHQ